MRLKSFSFWLVGAAIGVAGCSQTSEQPAAPAQTALAQSTLRAAPLAALQEPASVVRTAG